MSTVWTLTPAAVPTSSITIDSPRSSIESAKVNRAISLSSVRSTGTKTCRACALSWAHRSWISMTWYPKAVFIGSVSSPTGVEKTVLSKAPVILPFGNTPSSPPNSALPWSAEVCRAVSAKSAPSSNSCLISPARSPDAAVSAAVGVLSRTMTLTAALAGTSNSSCWSL